jgi:hypothetical protein
VEGRSPSGGLIRETTPLSTAYFADGQPTEFSVETTVPHGPAPTTIPDDFWQMLLEIHRYRLLRLMLNPIPIQA